MSEVVDIFKNSKPVHPLAVREDWMRPHLTRLGKRVGDEIQEFSAEEARLRAKVAGIVALKGLDD